MFVASVCTYLWVKGGNVRKTVAIMLFVISLMQVVELFLWLHLKCANTNKILSLLIPLLLFFQPVVIVSAILYYNTGRLPSNYYKILLGGWMLFAPSFFIYVYNREYKCTTVGKTGHLVWPYIVSSTLSNKLKEAAYNTIMLIAIATLHTKWYGIFYAGLSGVSYQYIKKIYGHSWSSVWCHFVNTLAFGALFI